MNILKHKDVSGLKIIHGIVGMRCHNIDVTSILPPSGVADQAELKHWQHRRYNLPAEGLDSCAMPVSHRKMCESSAVISTDVWDHSHKCTSEQINMHF